MTTQFHIPVLLKETIDFLNIKKGSKYIDATLGGGGHSLQIAKKGGRILGIDQDPEAVEFAQKNFVSNGLEIITERASFTHLEEVAIKHGFKPASGILFDLGVSSFQFDTPHRGFSFQEDSALDMRMDPDLAVTAKDLVNGLTENELEKLFTVYGEENWSKAIAKKIAASRLHNQIKTTGELAGLIEQTVGFKEHIHPATRVFQALRIAVNDEINSLKDALPQAFDTLESGGRLVVISFHSLEDRVVKTNFNDLERDGKVVILTPKPILPDGEEADQNPRSRSAKLRAIEKI